MAAKRRGSPTESFQAPESLSISEKRAALQLLLEKANDIQVRDSSDATFKVWKDRVERTLVRVYGSPSTQIEHFNKLRFLFSPLMWSLEADYTAEHREAFDRDMRILTESIRAYIDELGPDEKVSPASQPIETVAMPALPRQVFISHASTDVKIVEDLIDLLQAIGLRDEQIFCSSVPGHGVALGENFLERIKNQLTGNDALILFVITADFFTSPISLCEMGAGWVLSRQHIPILVPPFGFKDMQGVIPLTQGLVLNDALKLNELKDIIERHFGLPPMGTSSWERKRDRVLDHINQKIGVT